MANEAGIRRVKGLYAPNFGALNLVMFGLAQALAAAMEQPGEGNAMFSDCIALAFFAHIARAYGSVPIGGPNARGGLAAWQLQRARDFINVNLAHDLSLEEIARECGLSSGYFARAFKRSTGATHQWLTKIRVDRAKDLCKDPRCELADIAVLCGFVDQNHFTLRIFQEQKVIARVGGAAFTAYSLMGLQLRQITHQFLSLTCPLWVKSR